MAEDFRARGAECDKLADNATDPTAKRLFREAANNWRTMAEQADGTNGGLPQWCDASFDNRLRHALA
jgi:hypothetical protein